LNHEDDNEPPDLGSNNSEWGRPSIQAPTCV